MGKLGSTLKCLVAFMTDNYNIYFPFLFTKINIADIFWRLVFSHLQAWNFCYVLPATYGRQVSLGGRNLWCQQHYKWYS